MATYLLRTTYLFRKGTCSEKYLASSESYIFAKKLRTFSKTNYLLRKLLTCSENYLLAQKTTYLLRKLLTCSENYLFAQETTYLLRKLLTCSGNYLFAQETTYLLRKLLTYSKKLLT